MRRQAHRRMIPEGALPWQRLRLEHVQQGVGGKALVQGGQQGGFVNQPAATDIDQDRAGLHGAEERGVPQVAGLGGQRAAQDDDIGVRQQRRQVIPGGDTVCGGVRIRIAPHTGDVRPERPSAVGDTLADGAEADDQPARPVDLAEGQPLPDARRLRRAALGAALEGVEHAGQDILSHPHGLTMASGKHGAFLDELGEHRVVEAGRAALHPLEVRRLQGGGHEGPGGRAEEGVGVGPDDVRRGLFQGEWRAGQVDLAAVTDKQRFNDGAMSRNRRLDTAVGVFVDQQSHRVPLRPV